MSHHLVLALTLCLIYAADLLYLINLFFLSVHNGVNVFMSVCAETNFMVDLSFSLSLSSCHCLGICTGREEIEHIGTILLKRKGEV